MTAYQKLNAFLFPKSIASCLAEACARVSGLDAAEQMVAKSDLEILPPEQAEARRAADAAPRRALGGF